MNTLDDLLGALRDRERFAPDPADVRAALDVTHTPRPPEPGDGSPTLRRPTPRRRAWAGPALLAAACVAVVVTASVVVAQHRRAEPSTSPPSVATSHPAPSSAESAPSTWTTNSGGSSGVSPATTTAAAVRPVLRDGPLAMIPGPPGVNSGNQAEQTKAAAGGVAMLVLIDGCARVWFPGSEYPGDTAVFDSNSTDWIDGTLSYWGVQIPFGQAVMTGFAASSMRELRAIPDAYVPAGCPTSGEVVQLNTLEPVSGSGLTTGTISASGAATGQPGLPRVTGSGEGVHFEAAWAEPDSTGRHDLIITTQGSSSCPALVRAAVLTQPQELTLVMNSDVEAGPEVCTTDLAPATTRIAVPADIDETRPLTVVVDDVRVVLPAPPS